MPFDASKELQFMWDKLHYYGQDRWLNIILTNWDKAYRRAYNSVYGVKKQDATLPWLLGLFGGVVGSQVMLVQVSFAPLFVSLARMGAETTLVSPEVTQNADEFMTDRKLEFGRILAVCSSSILGLIQTAKDNPDKITADDFEDFLSRSLVSPIWYPPSEPDVDKLAKKFERKMWAQAYYDATKTPREARQNTTAEIWNKYMDSRDPSEDDGKDLDAEQMQTLYRDFIARLHNVGMGEVSEVAIRRNVKYIVQELARPSPIEYPLPEWVKSYLQMTSVLKALSLGLGDPTSVMKRLPARHLTWNNVPT